MAPKDLDKLIQKYLEGSATAEECAFIDAWYASLGTDPGPVSSADFEERTSRAGTRMLSKLREHAQGAAYAEAPERKRRFLRPYIGIAASLLLLASVGIYLLPDSALSDPVAEQATESGFTSMENTSDRTRRVILPDGSLVEMSPSSRIRYANDANTPSRELFLEGEAYFDVAHNNQRPFYVYARNVVTKVLGTTFIVRAIGHDEQVTVSVKTGKVTVYTRSATHKKTVLVPNQEAVYDRRTDAVATQPLQAKQSDDQKRGVLEMHFEETPVSEVLAVLTRTYDIDIIFQEENLSGCVLTSSFFEEGLYDRIDVICTAIGATYRIVDARILIESNGCHIKPR